MNGTLQNPKNAFNNVCRESCLSSVGKVVFYPYAVRLAESYTVPVLEETVVRVEHLVGEEVEPLPRHASVVQPFLTLELHHQPLPHILRSQLHYLHVVTNKK